MNNNPGVYKIENTINGRFYIGGTVKKLGARWTEHRTVLNRGKHRNSLLQEDWTKYGEQAFQFIVLEVLPKDDVLQREQELINQFFDYGENCYNLSSRAISGGGRKYRPAPAMKKYLLSIPLPLNAELPKRGNLAKFIRDAIQEKLDRERK